MKVLDSTPREICDRLVELNYRVFGYGNPNVKTSWHKDTSDLNLYSNWHQYTCPCGKRGLMQRVKLTPERIIYLGQCVRCYGFVWHDL